MRIPSRHHRTRRSSEVADISRLTDGLTRPSWADPASPRLVESPSPTGYRPLLRIATAALCRMMLTVAMSLMLWAAAPALLGWQPTTVVTGSMEPRIKPGDVISARPVPAGSLKLGMILLVDDPDHANQLRLHRLVRFAPDGTLVLRGDANPQEDSSHIDRLAVHGVGSVRVPFVASPILWLHQQAWTKLAFLVALVLAVVAGTGLDRHLKPADETTAEPDSVERTTMPAAG